MRCDDARHDEPAGAAAITFTATPYETAPTTVLRLPADASERASRGRVTADLTVNHVRIPSRLAGAGGP